jgi:hypothetical protein
VDYAEKAFRTNFLRGRSDDKRREKTKLLYIKK